MPIESKRGINVLGEEYFLAEYSGNITPDDLRASTLEVLNCLNEASSAVAVYVVIHSGTSIDGIMEAIKNQFAGNFLLHENLRSVQVALAGGNEADLRLRMAMIVASAISRKKLSPVNIAMIDTLTKVGGSSSNA